jgi:hypothetical protein
MQSIRLFNGANKVSVLQNDPVTAASISYNLSSPLITTFIPSSTIPDVATLTYCQPVDTFYTFESLADRDKAKAVYFDLAVGVNSTTNIRTARVYLAAKDLSPSDTIYDIHRNYWYNVYINIVDPGMDSVYVNVVACPWNVAPVQDTVIGAGYAATTAVPFKLVKYYDSTDLSKEPTIAAINKHSKGASWIDLTVSDGTGWNLDFTSITGGNAGAILSADTGKTWHTSLSGTGNDLARRIYIYRPYIEDNEPKTGPSVTLKVNNQVVQTFPVQPRDSLIFPTNSYILRPDGYSAGNSTGEAYIPLNHVYDFWEDFLLPNGDTIPTGSLTLTTWQDNVGQILSTTAPTIINPTDRKNAYIRARAGAVRGNAVIAFNVGGTPYWSFHIWNTEYSPYEPAGQILYKTPNYNVKNVFMDRNLGAMDTLYNALTPGSAKGLYYQYGRKDPFLTATSPTTQPAANTASLRPRSAIQSTIQNPTKFYINSFVNHNLEDSCLWATKQKNKTAYDPCPEGYRVPYQDGSGDTFSPWYSANFSNGSGIFLNGSYSAAVKYYPWGYITIGGVSQTANGYYWTSFTGHNALNVASALILPSGLSGDLDKATGAYIRCVVDKNYILKQQGNKFGGYAAEILNDIQ